MAILIPVLSTIGGVVKPVLLAPRGCCCATFRGQTTQGEQSVRERGFRGVSCCGYLRRANAWLQVINNRVSTCSDPPMRSGVPVCSRRKGLEVPKKASLTLRWRQGRPVVLGLPAIPGCKGVGRSLEGVHVIGICGARRGL